MLGKCVFLATTLTVLSTASGYCETQTISCDDLNRNIIGEVGKMTVVDVRGEAEYLTAHIPGAINVPYPWPIPANGSLRDKGNIATGYGKGHVAW